MKIGGENNAGIVVGDEVLDVSAYAGAGTAAIEGEPLAPNQRLEDALDLYGLGIEQLRAIVARVESDAAHADECREAGWLVRLDSVTLNPPVVWPGALLAVVMK
jgi:hypothetical protein